MSFFIEKYATHLGVKPRLPHISDHFYPIEFDKYITIDPSQKDPEHSYANWSFVVHQIKDSCPDHNFIQVGLDKSYCPESVDKTLSGRSTLKNQFFAIKNSKLHIGIDCICSHISAHYNIPTVSLYSKYPSNYTKPIYADTNKFVTIDVDRGNNLPSFNEQGSSELINKIPPEDIISKSLDLLGIDHNYDKYTTINIGRLFPSSVAEIIPNFNPEESLSFKKILNLRFDYTKERKYAEKWLSRKCNILIDSPIDVSLLEKYKENIKGVTVFIDEDSFTEKYLKIIKTLGIPIRISCRNKEKISEIRVKFFDWNINEYKVQDKKDLDFYKDICDNTFYYSNKMLMSEGKQYSSKAAWEQGVEYREGAYEPIIDSDSFWEEYEHFNIYRYA